MTEGTRLKVQQKLENRLLSWKDKAVSRNHQINSLKKRLAETQESRDNWKSKYKSEQILRKHSEAMLKNNNLINEYSESVKYHHYDLFLINLCLQIKQAGNLSLRSCQAVLLVIMNIFGLPFKVPCINTIRNWEHKQGYYRLALQDDGESEYVLIIDESYFIGQQTLLLILGVNLSEYEFGHSIGFQDVDLLGLAAGPAWTGERIGVEIQKIVDRNYQISYCCSDGANNISKALTICDLKRVPDCTHYLSKVVEREYKNTEIYKSFIEKYALTNRQNYMSKDSEICPPKLKGNSRFLNLYSFSNWAKQNLNLVGQLANLQRTEKQERIYGKLKWLLDYKDFINQLSKIGALMKIIFEELKANGISQSSIKKVQKIIRDKSIPRFFSKGVEQYLGLASIHLKENEEMICCSDIIESHFGKFKNKQRQNPEKSITIDCLTIANYGKPMNKQELKQAMEKVLT